MKIAQTDVEIVQSILDREVGGELLLGVVETARKIFEFCGRPDDFCLQHAGAMNIIFGGWNRVIWSPRHGWRYDKQSCTDSFIKLFKDWLVQNR